MAPSPWPSRGASLSPLGPLSEEVSDQRTNKNTTHTNTTPFTSLSLLSRLVFPLLSFSLATNLTVLGTRLAAGLGVAEEPHPSSSREIDRRNP